MRHNELAHPERVQRMIGQRESEELKLVRECLLKCILGSNRQIARELAGRMSFPATESKHPSLMSRIV
jgi:hypothetical protein